MVVMLWFKLILLKTILFTKCAWIDENTIDSFVTVSVDLQHGKFSVNTFIANILKQTYPNIKK